MTGSLERLRRVFDSQRNGHFKEPVPSVDVRLKRITRLASAVAANRRRLHDAIREDFGAHDGRLTDLMEIGPVLQRAAYVTANLHDWISPRHVGLGPEHGTSRGRVLYLPKGVMGNISPWNFPIESALVMCVDMIAAGNRVIVKPSEFAPATAQAVEDLVAGAFEESELAVLQGDAEFARAFADMPWDHLTFTGSPRVGRLVAQAAARRLVPVTLELGGKNPALFLPDAITDELVRLFLSFRTLKAGQVCTSLDYVLVPENGLESWIDRACATWRAAYTHVKSVFHGAADSIVHQVLTPPLSELTQFAADGMYATHAGE